MIKKIFFQRSEIDPSAAKQYSLTESLIPLHSRTTPGRRAQVREFLSLDPRSIYRTVLRQAPVLGGSIWEAEQTATMALAIGTETEV